MMAIPADFKALLPVQAKHEPDLRPAYYLWLFDPTDASVHISHNESSHPADAVTHKTMAPHVVHPERMRGYAYSIEGGWRITDDEHQKIDDPFILKRIRAALRQEHPPAPLPSIRYHGDPR